MYSRLLTFKTTTHMYNVTARRISLYPVAAQAGKDDGGVFPLLVLPSGLSLFLLPAPPVCIICAALCLATSPRCLPSHWRLELGAALLHRLLELHSSLYASADSQSAATCYIGSPPTLPPPPPFSAFSRGTKIAYAQDKVNGARMTRPSEEAGPRGMTKNVWVGFESFRLINRTINWYINRYGWLAGHISWPDDNNVGWTMIMFFVCFIHLFIFVLFYIVSSFFLIAVLPEEWSITTVAPSQCEMKWEQLLKGQNIWHSRPPPQDMWGHLRNSQPFSLCPCKCPTHILKPDLLDSTR